MGNIMPPALRCKHCGGALVDKLDEIACVLCGRTQDHICDNCQYLEEPKPVVTPRKSARKRKKGKKAGVA